jgi:hypothetical protein
LGQLQGLRLGRGSTAERRVGVYEALFGQAMTLLSSMMQTLEPPG